MSDRTTLANGLNYVRMPPGRRSLLPPKGASPVGRNNLHSAHRLPRVVRGRAEKRSPHNDKLMDFPDIIAQRMGWLV